jgi:hypothetical protein
MADRIDENENTVEEGTLFAESIYGANTRRGLVKLSFGLSFELVMSPDEARSFAANVVRVAEAAELDEIVVEWLGKRIGLTDDAQKVSILRDFREYRYKIQARNESENS